MQMLFVVRRLQNYKNISSGAIGFVAVDVRVAGHFF